MFSIHFQSFNLKSNNYSCKDNGIQVFSLKMFLYWTYDEQNWLFRNMTGRNGYRYLLKVFVIVNSLMYCNKHRWFDYLVSKYGNEDNIYTISGLTLLKQELQLRSTPIELHQANDKMTLWVDYVKCPEIESLLSSIYFYRMTENLEKGFQCQFAITQQHAIL